MLQVYTAQDNIIIKIYWEIINFKPELFMA